MSVYKINPEMGVKHFVTLTVLGWVDIFTKPVYFEILINSLKFCQREKGLVIHAYVFMTNHLHLIVSCNGCSKGNGCSEAQLPHNVSIPTTTRSEEAALPTYKKPRLSQVLQDFKRYTAKSIFKELFNDNRIYIQKILKNQRSNKNQDFQLWQHDNHPIVIESEKFFIQKLNYIHNNPVRKNYVDKQEDWLFSSARNYYLDDHSIIKIKLY